MVRDTGIELPTSANSEIFVYQPQWAIYVGFSSLYVWDNCGHG